MHLGAVSYDEFFEAHICDIAQTKTSKVKKIAIVAGADRRCDFYLKLGDALALNANRPIHNPGEPYYLFPELHAVAQPSRKIGSYIKSIYPVSDGGAVKYTSVAVGDLPAGLCAGSIRPGVINTLIASMPAELAVHTTGHELKNSQSSIYEYVDASTPLCIPGALVIAGWPAPRRGTLGGGVSPPSLRSLMAIKDFKMEVLDTLIDKLFHIDTSSPPEFQRGGRLRQMIDTAFASMILYHEERMEWLEWRQSCMKLEAIVRKYGGRSDARCSIKIWGDLVRRDFTLKNAPLLGRCDESGVVQLAAGLRATHGMLSDLTTHIMDLKLENRELKSMVGKAGPRDADAESDTAFDAALMAEKAADLLTTPTPIENLLAPVTSTSDAHDSAAEKNASQLYIKLMHEHKGEPWAALSRQHKHKILAIKSWFEAAATTEELKVMKGADTEVGERRRVVDKVMNVVRQRFAHEYRLNGKPIAEAVAKGKVLSLTTIGNELGKLKKLNEAFSLETADLSTFRKENEPEAVSIRSAKRARGEGLEESPFVSTPLRSPAEPVARVVEDEAGAGSGSSVGGSAGGASATSPSATSPSNSFLSRMFGSRS